MPLCDSGRAIPVKLKIDPQGKIVLNAAGRIDAAAEAPPGNARGVAFLLDMQLVPIARDILAGIINDSGSSCAVISFWTPTEMPSTPSSCARNSLAEIDRKAVRSGFRAGFRSWFAIKPQG